jgi:hypothetical protein
MNKDIWLKEPELHDFPAAQDYLELICTPAVAKKIVAKLTKVKTIQKKAKDILRASRLPLLTKDNIHVKENLKKIEKGKKLSPVLLVVMNGKLHIADGYHRCCTVYAELSEDLTIPCRIVYF